MRHATILVAILAFVPLTSATAQVRRPPIKPGTRVRISHECGTRTLYGGATRIDCRTDKGTLAALTADSVVLRIGEPATQLAVSLASVKRLEVVRGRKSNAATGAGIGLVVGMVAGAVIGYASYEECEGFCMFAPAGRGETAVFGAALFGLGGIVFGALIGASSKTDRWEEVPLDRLRVSLGPQRDGSFGFGASVRF
ncbi:MAG: hypothetical protein IH876_16010 [Gemmatimonadetes bacterium]|nr:hypothetical protein [Gemmatimonadota bacterium]